MVGVLILNPPDDARAMGVCFLGYPEHYIKEKAGASLLLMLILKKRAIALLVAQRREYGGRRGNAEFFDVALLRYLRMAGAFFLRSSRVTLSFNLKQAADHRVIASPQNPSHWWPPWSRRSELLWAVSLLSTRARCRMTSNTL